MEPILDQEQLELEQALMRAGRDVVMSPELRAKTLLALGVGTAGAATLAATKAGTLAWFTTKSGLAWTAGILGTLGVAGTLVLASNPRAEPPSHSVSGTPPHSAAPPDERAPLLHDSPPQQSAPKESEPVVVPLSDLEEIEDEDVAEGKAPAAEKASPELPMSSGLGDELAHMAKVEAALRAGQQGEALSLLREYRARFPVQRLGLEAEVLTIQAMYESGSVAAAKSRARRFLKTHPTSPLGARAKQYLRE